VEQISPSTFYIGAAVLGGLAIILLRETSPYTRSGGSEFEKRQLRRILGTVLSLIALLCLGLALVTQLSVP
jgi:hypothetical protein